jgi:hypothetical protein
MSQTAWDLLQQASRVDSGDAWELAQSLVYVNEIKGFDVSLAGYDIAAVVEFKEVSTFVSPVECYAEVDSGERVAYLEPKAEVAYER